MVEFLPEDDFAYVGDIDNAAEIAESVYHSEYFCLLTCERIDQFAEVGFWIDMQTMLVNDGIQRHEGKDGLVLMVGDELSFLG